MRSLFLAFLLSLFPVTACAQQTVPAAAPAVHLYDGRPSFATTGVETMPQMSIDEQSLQPERFASLPFPPVIWSEMKACAAAHGYDVSEAGEAPRIVVVPAARTIRVNDMTLDSLMYAEDSTFVGERWTTTIAYSLVRSRVIVLVDSYQANRFVLRHEALHFILWRSAKVLAHPRDLYEPCDRSYE